MYSASIEANIINDVFRKQRAGFRIDPTLRWRVTPAFALFKLDKRGGEDINKLNALRDNIEHALHHYRYSKELVGDTDRTFVRVNLQPLQLEVNLPKPGFLPYKTAQIDPHTALCGVVYGIRGDTPLLWNPADSTQPHALIAGTTGSGKTKLLQSLLLSMCAVTDYHDLRITVCDFKNSESLRWLGKLPHVERVVAMPDEALALLESLYGELIDRIHHGHEGKPQRIVVIDELASFTKAADKRYKERTTFLLSEMARLAREFRINLVLCTQTPTVDVLGEMKRNIPVRMVGMVTSPEESKTATGVAQAGAHLLPGKGAFIYVNAGIVRRFQAPLIDDVLPEIRLVRAKWGGADVAHRPLPVATTTTTKPLSVVVDEVAQDVERIRDAYGRKASQAEMIRILTGDPLANTGGANRRRLLTAIERLNQGATTTTAPAPLTTPQRVKQLFFGSSSSVKPM